MSAVQQVLVALGGATAVAAKTVVIRTGPFPGYVYQAASRSLVVGSSYLKVL